MFNFSMRAYVSILRKLIIRSFYNWALPKSSLKSGSTPGNAQQYILDASSKVRL